MLNIDRALLTHYVRLRTRHQPPALLVTLERLAFMATVWRRLVVLAGLCACFFCALMVKAQTPAATIQASAKPDDAELSGWQPSSPREEIRPTFSFDLHGGPNQRGALIITTADSVGQQGHYRKSFPIKGGEHYRFHALRKVEHVDVPRRSVIARVVWLDAVGKPVLADVPSALENEPGSIPLAEPEHPLDGDTDSQGWTQVLGVYRAPTKATQAIVELHLQWAPLGRVAWSNVTLTETSPPPSRKVRLATIHHVPSGKSARANCEEYAPLLAEAAKQKADLAVLGETVPYVRLGKKPHETAEPIPGPSTNYFGELALENKLHIAVSLYERDGHEVYNTAVLLGPDGKLIGKYRKVCLPHSEVEAGVTPGHEYPVFDTKFGKVGLMVCYDGFFPEVARELTNRGAEVIAWPVWGCNPLLAQARACENHVYVVSSTYTDTKSNWMLSAVFDHSGKAIAKANQWGDVAIAEVDLSQRHFWRNNLGDFRSMAQRHRPQWQDAAVENGAALIEKSPSPSASSEPPARSTSKREMKTVAILLFDSVELMDFAGPAEVFIVAERGRAFRVVTVAESTKPLKTMGGITVMPDFSFENAPQADVLIVPGGNTSAIGKSGREWLRSSSSKAEITMSVCYGALVLADEGLLNDIEATTHHWALDDLKQAAPKCKVVTGQRFVDSGKIITTAGVTAGIDGALRIVERLQGPAAARWAAEEWMEHRRP